MTQYAIVTDVNQCVGCLACVVACKTVNDVPLGNFWTKTIRVGPHPKEGGSGQFPDVEMYFFTLHCQHCKTPQCVSVCPTGASYKRDDGTVQIDKDRCIGCQFCVMACPYNVRYLNEEKRVVEKCTLCEQKVAQGELPQCVAQCGGRARYFGDLDQGLDSFEAPTPLNVACTDSTGKTKVNDVSYEANLHSRAKLKDTAVPYSNDDIYHLPDVGNGPSVAYILRNRKWHGGV
jgi:Fe-S-cluster-containing dehydrogenase component